MLSVLKHGAALAAFWSVGLAETDENGLVLDVETVEIPDKEEPVEFNHGYPKGDGVHDDYAGEWPNPNQPPVYVEEPPAEEPDAAPEVDPSSINTHLPPEMDSADVEDNPDLPHFDEHGNVLNTPPELDFSNQAEDKQEKPSDDTGLRRRLQGSAADAKDAFTILFFSDVEENYRGHWTAHAQRVVGAMLKQGGLNLKYDYPFNNVRINPELYIHGGDAANMWYGGWKSAVAKIFNQNFMEPSKTFVWNKFYEANKIFMSVMGNHDWKPNVKEGSVDWKANMHSNDFVDYTFKKAKEMTKNRPDSQKFDYERIYPKRGLSQSYYIGKYKGVQLAFFNERADAPGMDRYGNTVENHPDMIEDMKEKLDQSKTTVFVSHEPLGSSENGARYAKQVITPFAYSKNRDYPQGVHLSGHTHQWGDAKPLGGSNFEDHTVSYPYDNYHKGNKRGYLAVLVSPTKGVLQVKKMGFSTGCWKKGTRCLPGTTCEDYCCWDGDQRSEFKGLGEEAAYQYWHSKVHHACGKEFPWPNGWRCAAGSSCNRCQNGYSYHYGKAWTACGPEPKWENGRRCLAGTSCKACRNSYSWWYTKGFTACGTEPKWPNGKRCAAGTSCNRCANGYQYWHRYAWTACGAEPKWPNGWRCAAGTSCNRCANSYQYWYSKAWTACGREPCWKSGSYCLIGTSCNRCCNSYHWYSKCK